MHVAWPGFNGYRQDLAPRLPKLRVPTLLLWGDADPISPVQLGEHLAALLPQAELHVVPGGQHDLGCTFAEQAAPLIDRYLSSE